MQQRRRGRARVSVADLCNMRAKFPNKGHKQHTALANKMPDPMQCGMPQLITWVGGSEKAEGERGA